jgi:hypothetical protein
MCTERFSVGGEAGWYHLNECIAISDSDLPLNPLKMRLGFEAGEKKRAVLRRYVDISGAQINTPGCQKGTKALTGS